MSDYIAEAFAPAEERHRQAILGQTWGHLAPRCNKKYDARIVYALGCFGSDSLNPMVLVADFGGLDSSPWFYNSLHEFLGKEGSRGDDNAGKIYEWRGTFRNYKFKGEFRLLLDSNALEPRLYSEIRV